MIGQFLIEEKKWHKEKRVRIRIQLLVSTVSMICGMWTMRRTHKIVKQNLLKYKKG